MIDEQRQEQRSVTTGIETAIPENRLKDDDTSNGECGKREDDNGTENNKH